MKIGVFKYDNPNELTDTDHKEINQKSQLYFTTFKSNNISKEKKGLEEDDNINLGMKLNKETNLGRIYESVMNFNVFRRRLAGDGGSVVEQC